MKNRFGRMGSTLMGALLLLSVSGVTYSCKDDSLDTQKPSFLGGSIYDELNARGFKYTVRLIEDLGYKDVMSQTGSKTLFVASDKLTRNFSRTILGELVRMNNSRRHKSVCSSTVRN